MDKEKITQNAALLTGRPQDGKKQFILPPVPHKNYTANLLGIAATAGLIPEPRLLEIRQVLHTEAGNRARSFINGATGSVSRAQAEDFYASVLCQLDAALLALHDDRRALDALCQLPVGKLLDAGLTATMQYFETAKEKFRAAYPVLERYGTFLTRELLVDFEKFITKYDARWHATRTYVQFGYPLLGRPQIPEGGDANGAAGVCLYYTALENEARILQCFEHKELLLLYGIYAIFYRTTPSNIADNLVEIALRNWLTASLAHGSPVQTVRITGDDISQVQACYGGTPANRLTEIFDELLAGSMFAQEEGLVSYIQAALPDMAAQFVTRLSAGTLDMWAVRC